MAAAAKTRQMFKAVPVVDTSGTTNLAGTDFETGTKPISPAVDRRNAISTITPAKSAVLVNLLNAVQLGRFGMNIDNAAAIGNGSSSRARSGRTERRLCLHRQ